MLFSPRECNLPWFKAESKDDYLLALILICAIKQKLSALKKAEKRFHQWSHKTVEHHKHKGRLLDGKQSCFNGLGGSNIFLPSGRRVSEMTKVGPLCIFQLTRKTYRDSKWKGQETRDSSELCPAGQGPCVCPELCSPSHAPMEVSEGASPWPHAHILEE